MTKPRSARLAIDKSVKTARTLFNITSPYLTAIVLILGATLWL